MTDTEEQAVWVRTELTGLGTGYSVTVSIGADQSRVLNPTEAREYAETLLRAAAYAEYDATVFRQMSDHTGIGRRLAAGIVVDLRKDRVELDHEAMAPLRVEPGVNQNGDGFLSLFVDGEQIGQWTVADARQHAEHVLSTVVGADLDSAYHRVLMGTIGLGRDRASQIVADLQNYVPSTRH